MYNTLFVVCMSRCSTQRVLYTNPIRSTYIVVVSITLKCDL